MKDSKHYLALMAILSIGLGLFLYFGYNRQVQIGIVIALSAAYVVWGIFHHSLKKELHLKIILEYIAVATLASIVVIFLL
ncbi:unnamed protein product, partial [marine sediment metagenome]